MDSSNIVQVVYTHTCFLCGRKMHDKDVYREHMKLCSFISDDGVRLFPCVICGEELQSKSEYMKHLEVCFFNSDYGRNHLGEQTSVTEPLSCGSCGRKFINANHYDAHVEMGICTIEHFMKIEPNYEEHNREVTDELCGVVADLSINNNIGIPELEASVNSVNAANFEVMETRQTVFETNSSTLHLVEVPAIPDEDPVVTSDNTERKSLIEHVATEPNFLKLGKVSSKSISSEITVSLRRNIQTVSSSGIGNSNDFKYKVPSKNLGDEIKSKWQLKQNATSAHNCNTCEKKFGDKFDLIKHKTVAHKKFKDFKCDICYREFSRKSDLSRHIGDVHEKLKARLKAFKCHICSKEFSWRSHLNKHITAVHEKLKNYKCDICNKEFGWKSHLNRHITAVHEKLKEAFKCDVCGKGFGQKSDLNKHITTAHEELKNFKCDVCGKEFGHKNNLNEHITTVHEKLKVFKCNVCSKEFCRKSNLNGHITAVHEKLKNFKCNICRKKFSSKYYLNQHIAILHKKIKKFKCHFCKEEFSYKYKLNQHSCLALKN